MRQHHYTFAHRTLRDAVLDEPAVALRELSGRGAAKWLRGLWDTAGAASGSAEAPELLRVANAHMHGYDTFVITFPPALHPTEAWGALVAFEKLGAKEPRYFLLERGVDADDTGHWAEYRPGGMRIRGEYVPGTDPQLLVFAAKVAMGIPPDWKIEAEAKAAQAADPKRRKPRTVPTRFAIPGWDDEDLLARIVANYRGVTFLVMLTLLTMGGAVAVGALGYLEIAGPLRTFQDANDRGLSAYKVCMDRADPDRPGYDKKVQRKICKSETKGLSLLEYTVGRRSGWKQWAALAAGLFALGGFWMALTIFFRVRVPRFVKVLRNQPQDVVWVYLYRVSQRGGGTVLEEVTLGLVNGSKCTIDTVGPAQDVLRNVAALTPRATLGYSEEHAKRFRTDPRSMARW